MKNKKSTESEKIPLYIYISNVYASEKQPFELYLENEKIYKCIDRIEETDLIVLQSSVEAPIPDEDNGDELILKVNLRVKMPIKLANVIQTLNISKHGHHIKVGLDEIKGSISINQSHEEFDDETKESKKNEKLIFLNLQNIPSSKEYPFKIYFDENLIYQHEDILREPMTLNFPLKQNEQVIKIKCTFNEKEIEEMEFKLEKGYYIGIIFSKKKLSFHQQEDDDFERVFDLCKVNFTLHNISSTKELPFQISTQRNLFFETFESIQLFGFQYSFQQYQDGDILLYVEVSDLKNEFYEEVQFNLSKFGFNIQIKVTNDQIIFLQSFQSFKFLKLQDYYFSIDKINPRIITPIEDLDDDDLLSLFNAQNNITSKQNNETNNISIPKVLEFPISISSDKLSKDSENLKLAVDSLEYLFDSQELSKEEFEQKLLILEKFDE